MFSVKIFWVLALILGLMNFYVANALRLKMGTGGWGWGLFFAAFFALQLVAPLCDMAAGPYHVREDNLVVLTLVRASYLALGAMSILFVYTFVLNDALGLILKILFRPADFRPMDKILSWSTLALLAATMGFGLYNAGRVRVERVDLSLPRLPQAFDGYRIVQISDLHVGVFLGRPFIEKIAQEIEALSPDMIVLTGDVGDGMPKERLDSLAPLARLHPRDGKYFVPGNHEYYWGVQKWSTAMTGLGFRALINEHVLIARGAAQLALAGVPDPTSKRLAPGDATDPEKAAPHVTGNVVKILLSHQPEIYPLAQKAGFDAQLSGHTHGGQYFPYTFIVRLFQPHERGLYDFDGFKLYVNRGAGFWGPPLRTNGPGEITLLTLFTGAGS